MKRLTKQLIKCGCLCLLLFFVRASALCAQEFTATGHVELLNDVTGRSSLGAANAVVWLTRIPQSPSPIRTRLSRQSLRIAQRHKAFDPHVLAVEVGSAVQFPNYDPFFHNVFSLFEGKRFDLGLYEAGSSRLVVFDRPGICYLFCNIHPEMSAVVLVLNTPYFAVTDPTGDLRIPNVPSGRYELRVWCERSLPDELKSLTHEITISEEAQSLGTIRLKEIHVQPRAHKNKYGQDYNNPAPPNSVYSQP
jgi:plastocyanin